MLQPRLFLLRVKSKARNGAEAEAETILLIRLNRHPAAFATEKREREIDIT